MSSTCQREMSLTSSTKLEILGFDKITSMRDLLRRLYELLIGSDYGWFEDEDASESRAAGDQVEKIENQLGHLENKKKDEALERILKSRIPGFKEYIVSDSEIAVVVEPEVGYGEFWNWLIFKDDVSKRVKVPSGHRCDALAGIEVACKWSDVIFPIPGDARIFYGKKDSIQVFKQGDTVESLMIEAGLQGECSNV